jgi:hypothetical protein
MVHRIFFEKLIVTQHIKQQPAFFMEPEGSLPCSQNPTTGPYPEPKHRLEDNIKTDLKEMTYDDANWTELAQNMVQF